MRGKMISSMALLQTVATILVASGAQGMSIGENTTRCYEPYGCFDVFYPWTDVTRPVNYLPESPEKINARFCLLTRRNSNKCQYLSPGDPNTFYWANVNQHDYTYVICHGFVEDGSHPWIKRLAGELLKNRDANVIIVDWGKGAQPPYTQAVGNTRLVGAITAQLLSNLQVVGVHSSRVHFIGHSLGAHIGGYAGLIMRTQHDFKLGRITGMDPAAPHFSGTMPEVRLDPSDADFVDVIHSDTTRLIAGGFGTSEPCGHVDFYPNGGENQPGCSDSVSSYFSVSIMEGFRRMIGCDHVRSHEYFTESVNAGSNCSFQAVECGSWQQYLAGECSPCSGDDGRLCARLGFHADELLGRRPTREHVKLFLTTDSTAPYCKSQYRVKFQVSCSESSIMHNGDVGILSVTIHGDRGVASSIPLVNEQRYLAPGSTHQMVVAAESVGNIVAITLEWKYPFSLFNLLRLISRSRSIYIDWLSVESLDQRSSLKVCLPADTPLRSNIPSKKLYGCPRETRQCPANISYMR